ncbi:hypothetical protein QTP81_01855 [Alteromonas sp. ASW11-36]|uniref:Lipoprotein n=1 Tax=Alteromonas arenosi TaxID=3055817 RepID=A0ABT7SUY0_9ALTE|nr:hypothetical protein [Alteromonas sp. ASW11-36]MDM7859349.1 hypothetical protein [Alteromonas sp. ASW11-36]
MMKRFKKLACASVILLLSGCSSTSILDDFIEADKPKLNLSDLHAVGNFNWFEIIPEHQFVEVTETRYVTEIELIADGQPYDFHLADQYWTPHTKCGFRDVVLRLELNQEYQLYCAGDSQNLQFTPDQTGRFAIWIESNDDETSVSIKVVRL